MGDLEQQVHGLILTCRTVINSPRKADPPDVNTIVIAREILEQAKATHSSDPILQKIDFHGSVPDWPGLLAAMETIARSLRD